MRFRKDYFSVGLYRGLYLISGLYGRLPTKRTLVALLDANGEPLLDEFGEPLYVDETLMYNTVYGYEEDSPTYPILQYNIGLPYEEDVVL